MCRYSYRSGACANRLVESLECVGEEECQHAQTNILIKKGRTGDPSDCGLDRWLGLYCEKHGKFFCPGKEACETPGLYADRFEERQDMPARRPREE